MRSVSRFAACACAHHGALLSRPTQQVRMAVEARLGEIDQQLELLREQSRGADTDRSREQLLGRIHYMGTYRQRLHRWVANDPSVRNPSDETLVTNWVANDPSVDAAEGAGSGGGFAQGAAGAGPTLSLACASTTVASTSSFHSCSRARWSAKACATGCKCRYALRGPSRFISRRG